MCFSLLTVILLVVGAMRCGRHRGARLSNLSSYHSDARNNRGQFRAGRRNDMNDKNEQSQSQGQEVPPDPPSWIASFWG